MSTEEVHGASGRVETDEQRLTLRGGEPVRVELDIDGDHQNLLARDAEVMVTNKNGELTINLDLDDVAEVSHEDWQAGNHPDVE